MTSTPTLSAVRALAVLALLGAVARAPAAAQVVGRDEAPLPEPVDSADVHGRARREQATFERRRNRLLPYAFGAVRGGDSCDEIVGRFCLWFDEGEEKPIEEPEGVAKIRDQLLAYLDSVQGLLPADGWVLGQRVWYRGEAGRWAEALGNARACGQVEAWWCAALEGLALHGLGRYEEAEGAFDRALASMDPEEAARWREPKRVLRGGTRDLLRDADGDHDEVLDRLWALGDPSYLVPGNDRKTEHYARWTVAAIREHARNPYQIAWGGDLEELLVRFGWEVGWERIRTLRLEESGVVGHQRAGGREYLPGDAALRDPAAATSEDFQPGSYRPRELYTPAYAPVILPMDGQVAAFPRGDRLLVAATTFVPPDTTRHPGDDTPRPWMDAGDQADLPDRAGIFLVPVSGRGPVRDRTRVGPGDARLLVDVPAGSWVASAEAWSPPARVEGRTRVGIRRDTVPPDVATLSDLLLVDGDSVAPSTLEEAVDRALVHRTLPAGTPIGVVWEVNGLGWSPATLRYDLSLEAAGRGLFRRIGEGLRLMGPDRPLELSWEEPGPERPAPMLRHVSVAIPEVGAGTYRLRLRARVSGRADLIAATEIEIRR